MKTPLIKKWVCTEHALQRILERKITLEQLDLVIKKPDFVAQQGPKFILAKKIKGRKDNMLSAVVIEKMEKNLWIVITVMVDFQKS